mgnify:CR=1 FL=1
MSGRGVMTYPDASRYEGAWRDNKRHGRGVMVNAKGDRYEGEWANDRPNGLGEAVIDGKVARAPWVDGCSRDGGTWFAWGRPLSECQTHR